MTRNDEILDYLNSKIDRSKLKNCRWCGSNQKVRFIGHENNIFFKCECGKMGRGFGCFSCLKKDNEKINPTFFALTDSWNRS